MRSGTIRELRKRRAWRIALLTTLSLTAAATLAAQVAVRGEKVYTMAGAPIDNGVVLVVCGEQINHYPARCGRA